RISVAARGAAARRWSLLLDEGQLAGPALAVGDALAVDLDVGLGDRVHRAAVLPGRQDQVAAARPGHAALVQVSEVVVHPGHVGAAVAVAGGQPDLLVVVLRGW